ncbi:MAG: 16S rRNA (uracil(1498)-N(3))-methyltransferase [Puniceicoccales bacterium]|jgi:16S rRNA (uracil1498-N3)-methyltransferase|nr:16S rRNA (uracil(1498)-N(3))-methyltransferase [Puniceicoccales bacterium]
MLRCFCSEIGGAKSVTLSREESHHLVAVLRASGGAEVELIDGLGTVARGFVKKPDKAAAQVAISSSRVENRRFHLSLIQAALTNGNTEFVLKEACAIGVSEICILQAERSEAKIKNKLEAKLAHWAKLLIEACKQSGNPFLPKLSFAQNIEYLTIAGGGAKFFGHIGAPVKYLIQELGALDKPCNIAVAIGAEGDFSEREKELLLGKNFIGCKLSNNVLRSETAAIYALSVINSHMNSLC